MSWESFAAAKALHESERGGSDRMKNFSLAMLTFSESVPCDVLLLVSEMMRGISSEVTELDRAARSHCRAFPTRRFTFVSCGRMTASQADMHGNASFCLSLIK